ncbi:ABC transporter permease [Devosia rhizoryzae]|uniref:ABC transporter permease subunit n=1 Tax=Devosia rhizoryzae TaxID=2774137 RepID=A0ABX7C6C0_9HYPH|nr:ABC transporter permease subunit [Devosia rhizoryzae]QQR39815.1 ABC transporter permease subunit [Devosia rhizoryzae]
MPTAQPPSTRRIPWDALAVAPFILFAVLFLFLPTLGIVSAAFTDRTGNFTFENIAGLFTPQILSAYWISIRVSGASAILGTLIGLAVTLAIIRGRLPAPLRSAVMTFSGVASNFAGVPLAFAFIATLGRLGLATIVLRTVFGIDIYRSGFNLFSFWGLTITYLYFQIPLMMLTIAPAVDGLKKEWNEAAQTLGASTWQFWRYVGLPILWPSVLGTLSLLFASGFGAIATAWALTGSNLNIVTVLLYNQIRGDALQNPGLGAALALGMIVITSLANIIYLVVAARAERWMK